MTAGRWQSQGTTAGAGIINIPDADLEISFQRDRHRTLRLTVKPDGSVHAKAPAGMGMEAIKAFILSRLGWIEEKREFFLSHRGEEASIREGGIIWCRGTPRTIRAVPMRRGKMPVLLDDALELPCHLALAEDGICPEALLRRAFLAWRHAFAAKFLAERLAELDARARAILGDGAAFSRLTIKALKRRWGSCSAKGEICLASALTALPDDLIDFVILHELCHLRHMDHGPAFHAALRSLVPNEKALDGRLRIWGLEHPRI